MDHTEATKLYPFYGDRPKVAGVIAADNYKAAIKVARRCNLAILYVSSESIGESDGYGECLRWSHQWPSLKGI